MRSCYRLVAGAISCFWGFWINGSAQPGIDQSLTLHTEHFTTHQGLSNNRITSIIQDRDGFLWFGTQGGVDRFDGYEFVTIRTDPKRPQQTFRNDDIWQLFQDKKGQLWTTTLGDGLHLIDIHKRETTAYRLDSVSQFQYMNLFYGVTEDESADLLWVGTYNGLLRYDRRTRHGTVFKLPADMGEVSVFCPLIDAKGRLWLGTKAGLFLFDRKTTRFQPVNLPVEPGISQPIVSALSLDSDGRLWIGTNGEALFKLGATAEGLFQIDTRKAIPQAVVFPLGTSVGQPVAINHIQVVGNTVWLASDQGLFRINRATNQVALYRANRNRPDGLSSNRVLALCPDKDGNLWVGTDNGINKIGAISQHFEAYQLYPTALSVRDPRNNVNGVVEDEKGALWMGSPISGLGRVGPGSTQLIPVATKLRDKRIRTLFRDRQERVWVGTAEGLHRLDPQTGEFTSYPCRLPVQYIAQETNGRLWIAGQGGPAAFDPAQGTFTYLPEPLQNQMWYATAMCVSRTGQLWVGHIGGGVHRYDIKSGQVHQYLPLNPERERQYTAGLSDLNVTALYEHSDGSIWIGTQRGGLSVLNVQTGRFRWLTTDQELPTNYVLGIVADHRNRIWVSTEQGLALFQAKTGTFRTYDETDGLPMIQFTANSVSMGTHRLLFGSPDGCLAFNPDDLQPTQRIAPVFVTDLTVNGQERLLPTNRIELNYDENSLTFRFAMLNYRSSSRNRYRYQLSGLDDRWQGARRVRTARYTSLPPGEYVFRVQGANEDSLWNQQPTSLTVIIHPPWWHTWWAYTLYGLLILSGIWAFIGYRSRALRRENRRLEETVTNRTIQLQESLDDLKATQDQLIQKEKMASLGELTAGIAHEIQNPLNFVNNFAEISAELIDELGEDFDKGDIQHAQPLIGALQQNLKKISHHGNRAASIVKGMLAHSRNTTGDKKQTDLNALCNEYLNIAYQSYQARVEGFACTLVTELDSNLGTIAVIPQDVDRVLSNLFTNAFYAVQKRVNQLPKDGTYVPTIRVSTRQMPDSAIIQVSDNGIGIPESAKAKIFQPFFTTKPTGEGTGLGLSLSYDTITKGHRGTLTVESTEGEGTTFTISLPR